MLGNLHTSDVRRFIPCFIESGKAENGSHIFRLDWDSVDSYKVKEYTKWKTEHWEGCEDIGHPDTLPERYDMEVKKLHFLLNHNYKTEIEHFSRLFVNEMTRSRKFDTCVRERCLSPAVSAIGTAFYLLSDCIWSVESGAWFRGPWKRIYQHLLAYKFWRCYTGRGLVWEHARLHRLETDVRWMLDNADPFAGPRDEAELFSEVTVTLRRWEEEQEKFWDHAVEDVPAVNASPASAQC